MLYHTVFGGGLNGHSIHDFNERFGAAKYFRVIVEDNDKALSFDDIIEHFQEYANNHPYYPWEF